MDFLFVQDSKLDRESLHQGDLILRTDRLKAAFEQAHSYYATKDDYTHFVRWIGTDLVRKGVEFQIRGDRPIKWTATPPKEMQPFQVQWTPDRQKVVVVYGPLTRRLRDGPRTPLRPRRERVARS